MTRKPGPLGRRIAAELRAELGRRNMSRRALADSIGQPHVTVSRWLNADTPVPIDMLDDMARALGLTIGEILDRADTDDDPATVPAPRVAFSDNYAAH